jgi:hypothetical protein
MKERFKEAMRRLLGGWFFPEIAELEGRLKVCHARMQEMYWDEKDKEMTKAYAALREEEITALVLELRRVDPGNEKVKGYFFPQDTDLRGQAVVA